MGYPQLRLFPSHWNQCRNSRTDNNCTRTESKLDRQTLEMIWSIPSIYFTLLLLFVFGEVTIFTGWFLLDPRLVSFWFLFSQTFKNPKTIPALVVSHGNPDPGKWLGWDQDTNLVISYIARKVADTSIFKNDCWCQTWVDHGWMLVSWSWLLYSTFPTVWKLWPHCVQIPCQILLYENVDSIWMQLYVPTAHTWRLGKVWKWKVSLK